MTRINFFHFQLSTVHNQLLPPLNPLKGTFSSVIKSGQFRFIILLYFFSFSDFQINFHQLCFGITSLLPHPYSLSIQKWRGTLSYLDLYGYLILIFSFFSFSNCFYSPALFRQYFPPSYKFKRSVATAEILKFRVKNSCDGIIEAIA